MNVAIWKWSTEKKTQGEASLLLEYGRRKLKVEVTTDIENTNVYFETFSER